MAKPLWKIVWWFLTKLNMLLSCDPEITLLGIYPNALKTYVHTKPLQTDIYSNFIHNRQNLEAAKMSFSR